VTVAIDPNNLDTSLAELSVFDLTLLSWRMRWLATARDNQRTPAGNWDVWLILAGRGFGKTRTGAEDTAWYATQNPGHRCSIIAPTSGDIRDTCIEGESGMLSVLPETIIRSYNRTISEIVLENGSVIKGFSVNAVSKDMTMYSKPGNGLSAGHNLNWLLFTMPDSSGSMTSA